MQPFIRYSAENPDYPNALRRHLVPPTFTATGPLGSPRCVAIVGSRQPIHEAAVFAYQLSSDLARAGITVVSGGAKGIDAAAHRGALEAGGATWVVCPTGKDRISPPEHRNLFDDIAASKRGRLIWPFEDDAEANRDRYHARNRLLVTLSEAVVVIQARVRSGSRGACTAASELKRPLWVVPALPWGYWEGAFNGSAEVLLTDPNARPLGSSAQLFAALRLPAPFRPDRRPDRRKGRLAAPSLPLSRTLAAGPRRGPDDSWTEDEKCVFTVTSDLPRHREILAETAGLSMASASTALLTLTLKDVVVEGPNGFFRRSSGA